MLNRKQEIKEYSNILKQNEAEITRLTGVNKHIKTHIKFLQTLGEDEGEFEGATIDNTPADEVTGS